MNFVRYADDFIVTGESPEFLREEVLPIIRDFMTERGLQLGCVASSTASLQKSPRITKIFCKNWNNRVMRSSAENTLPSRAHDKNGSSDSKRWAQAIARTN